MITHYKCANEKCSLYGTRIPYTRALRAKDGKGMICSECEERLVVAKNVKVTGGPRGGSRGGGASRRSSRR